MFKVIVIFMLLVILGSLGSGLFYLMRDRSGSSRTVKALTMRIGLSFALFALLLIGSATGLITPHSFG